MQITETRETLSEIRSLMARSAKFSSLSGMAGVSAGLICLLLSFIYCLSYKINPFDFNYSEISRLDASHSITALWFALLMLFSSTIAAYVLTKMNAGKLGDDLKSPAVRLFVSNMVFPFGFSLVFCLLLYFSHPDLVLPVSLILYGLIVFNAGKYTHNALRLLAIVEMLLGILCLLFMKYHILFWVSGFGLMHIVFGIYMILKPERN
jgi:hypothetical protein